MMLQPGTACGVATNRRGLRCQWTRWLLWPTTDPSATDPFDGAAANNKPPIRGRIQSTPTCGLQRGGGNSLQLVNGLKLFFDCCHRRRVGLGRWLECDDQLAGNNETHPTEIFVVGTATQRVTVGESDAQ